MTTTPQPSVLSLLDGSSNDTLSWITSAVRDTIPGVDFASISVTRCDGHLETVGATDPLALKVDALQYELGGGPCVDAALGTPVARSDDVASETRWPRYADRAGELGIKAQVSFALHCGNRTLGALNLYSTSSIRLDNVALDLAQRFADRAAAAMELTRNVDSLSDALVGRKTIGQAVGIVLERFSLNEQRPCLQTAPGG